MAEGRFREQLYHRLRECEIFIPPLRERTDDIPAIVEFYITKHNKELGDSKSVSPGAIEYLREYPWPGNIRELANYLRVALQTMSTDELEVADLHRIMGRATLPTRPTAIAAQSAAQPAAATSSSSPESPASDDRSTIEQALTRTAGNVTKAASHLGMSRETLHNRIKKLGIDVTAYRQV
jgi:DNA-binding NtrC family response regulator